MSADVAERLPYTDVAAALEASRTRSQLLTAGERIQHVEGIENQNRLGAVFKRRLDELKTTTGS